MSYSVRFTEGAEADLLRLYDYLLQQNPSNLDLPKKAYLCITQAMEILKNFPFACRKATENNPYIRELLISFGTSGYVALFEIEPKNIVTILAVRHQREDDYY